MTYIDPMISKDIIEDVIDYWSEDIEKAEVIHRDLSDLLLETRKMEEVTVLKGVRRSGKTFMLYELKKAIGGTYINFEDDRLDGFGIEDFDKLFDLAMKSEKAVLYLDEVQEVKGWEKFAHRAHRKVKIFVTGSNSRLLSSDFSKGLVGRTKSITSTPLSFGEFLRFKNLENSRGSLLDYMSTGGFPRIVLSGDIQLVREYYDRILYRDIIARNSLRNPEALKTISDYLLSNIGKEFSYRSLKQISGLKHETTIKEYVGLLQDGFLLSILKSFSPSIKKQEGYSRKIYAVDPGFIGLGKRMDLDQGRILENVVFNHLNRMKDLYYWKNSYEVDFLRCEGLKPITAINTTFEAKEDTTMKRELKGLKKAGENFKIPVILVSVYPIKGLPEEINHRLAHHFLNELDR